MGSRWNVSQAWLPFLIVLIAAVGCGIGPAVVADERDRPNEASLGKAYVLAGFGEGSLWATDILTCNDTSGPEEGEAAACGAPANMSIERLDPRTGKKEAAVKIEGFFANTTAVTFGAGSAWLSSADYSPEPVEKRQPWDVVYRIDPKTNRVVDRISVDSPTGLDFGFGSVWVASAGHGTVSRIDPKTGEVVAKIKVGRGAVDVAADKHSGSVWVAGLHLPKNYDGVTSRKTPKDNKLTRIDPKANRVAAEIPIRADTPNSGAQGVATGNGAVWVTSDDGRLLKVDPATNKVAATVPLGDYSSDLAVSGGSIWVSGQNNSGPWLKRVDPNTVEVVWSRSLGSVESGGYGRLAADGDRVWVVEGGAGTGKLARISP